ncbi:hypothetical protein D910_06503 [Dendroctonus ponderosae]|uniref:Uncharacterized protein n=1 Tax=Dendroctonus ponderosae TaxID=77166 RepID=U4U7T6_DENPD|nr:hypothetical protein D910_06503 [Dendroctonus ponderosae]
MVAARDLQCKSYGETI